MNVENYSKSYMDVNFFMKIGLILIAFVLLCNIASADIRLSDSRIFFDNTSGDVPYANLSMAYTAIANDDVLLKINDTCYLANYRLCTYRNPTVDLSDVTLLLNDTIPIAGGTYDIYTYDTTGGAYIFNNTTVGAWNTTLGTWTPLEQAASAAAYPNLYHAKTNMYIVEMVNSEFIGFTSIGILNSNDVNISNNYIHDSYNGFDIVTSDNVTFHNNTILRSNGGFLLVDQCNYFNIDHLYANATSENYGLATTAGIGVNIANSHFTSITNSYIAYAGWSGLQVGGYSPNCYGDNITLLYNQHVGLDLHPGIDSIYNNVYVTNSSTEGILFTTNTENASTNVTINGAYVSSDGGRSYDADAGSNNIRLLNIVSDGYVAAAAGGGVELFSSDNITVINYSQIGTSHAYGVTLDSAGETSDIRFFDSNLVNATSKDIWFESNNHYSNVFGNMNYSVFDNDDPVANTVYVGYYPNLKVVDGEGSGIPGAVITFDNPVLDAWGDIATEFITDDNGYLNISDRSQMPLINSSQEYIITASYENETGNVTGIQANSTWFSLDTTSLQGDLITIVIVSGSIPSSAVESTLNSSLKIILISFFVFIPSIVVLSSVYDNIINGKKAVDENTIKYIMFGSLIIMLLVAISEVIL